MKMTIPIMCPYTIFLANQLNFIFRFSSYIGPWCLAGIQNSWIDYAFQRTIGWCVCWLPICFKSDCLRFLFDCSIDWIILDALKDPWPMFLSSSSFTIMFIILSGNALCIDWSSIKQLRRLQWIGMPVKTGQSQSFFQGKLVFTKLRCSGHQSVKEKYNDVLNGQVGGVDLSVHLSW